MQVGLPQSNKSTKPTTVCVVAFLISADSTADENFERVLY